MLVLGKFKITSFERFSFPLFYVIKEYKSCTDEIIRKQDDIAEFYHFNEIKLRLNKKQCLVNFFLLFLFSPNLNFRHGRQTLSI